MHRGVAIGASLIIMCMLHACSGSNKSKTSLATPHCEQDDAVSALVQRPTEGYVKNESTALQIAEAIAIAHYGKAKIDEERPLQVRLEGDMWIVEGTFHGEETTFGGVVLIRISKDTGCIVQMTHGK